MQRSKHKHKARHVVIIASDAVNTATKQYKLRPWILRVVTVVCCVLIGAVAGYMIYEGQIWEAVNARRESLRETVDRQEEEKLVLENEKKALENEIEGLNEQIRILRETVNQKVENETALTEQLEKQSIPSEFPLTGSASMEETLSEDNPICVFTVSPGITVVATAKGTVTAINDDVEYGHNVWVDHGNGYVTVYRNQGEAAVKQGDSVVQGTMLFTIGEDNGTLGYQMMLDGVYINPMDVLAISG